MSISVHCIRAHCSSSTTLSCVFAGCGHDWRVRGEPRFGRGRCGEGCNSTRTPRSPVAAADAEVEQKRAKSRGKAARTTQGIHQLQAAVPLMYSFMISSRHRQLQSLLRSNISSFFTMHFYRLDSINRQIRTTVGVFDCNNKIIELKTEKRCFDL